MQSAAERGRPNLPRDADVLMALLRAAGEDVSADDPADLQRLLDSLHASTDVRVQVALRMRVDGYWCTVPIVDSTLSLVGLRLVGERRLWGCDPAATYRPPFGAGLLADGRLNVHPRAEVVVADECGAPAGVDLWDFSRRLVRADGRLVSAAAVYDLYAPNEGYNAELVNLLRHESRVLPLYDTQVCVRRDRIGLRPWFFSPRAATASRSRSWTHTIAGR